MDTAGDLFVATERGSLPYVVEFDARGEEVSEFGESERTAAGHEFRLLGLGMSALGDLYAAYNESSDKEGAYIRVFGPPPVSLEAPPLRAPVILSQYGVSAGTGEARVRASINPRFWADTSYHVEYGTAPCSEGGCVSTGDLRLTGKVIDAALETQAVILSGLDPGTAYYYRFVAQSSGGGPVVGPEEMLRTFRMLVPGHCAANEVFRTGAASLLPDCRAYEMVSPVDKGNSDIFTLKEVAGKDHAVLDQSAADGGKLTYGSARSFGGAVSAPLTSQYVAARTAAGWVSHPVSPAYEFNGSTGVFDTEFRFFAPDLCTAWLVTEKPLLAAGAQPEADNLYQRTDSECGGTAYETLTPASGYSRMELDGVSADGSAVIYVANGALTGNAPALAGEWEPQLYYEQAGQTRFVCILPNGEPSGQPCAAAGGLGDKFSNAGHYWIDVHGVLSSDGQRVFWQTGAKGSGPIYVRENPLGSGLECAKPQAPCTLAVSHQAEELQGTEASTWLGAATDGSKAVFVTGGSLFEYRVADRSTHLIAGQVSSEVLLGMSDDGSHIYFTSKEALTGANDEGVVPAAGEPNLYLYRATEAGGGLTFIGTLKEELDPGAGSATKLRPTGHLSRVSGDGRYAAFVSSASLTGYDNTDAVTGELDAEVFLYEAAAREGKGSLVCVSCNPSGVRPHGEGARSREMAAWIPGSANIVYAPRVLSTTGGRLFFDAFDALVPGDTNGKADVYEWEAPGEGSCSEAASSYSSQDGGCIYLISSGESLENSEFVDADPSGENVFFTTLSSFASQDTGLLDIYDARVNGGLPAPPQPPAGCEGEACQAPPSAPAFSTPSSASFQGAGNLKAAKPSRNSKHSQTSGGKHRNKRGSKHKRNHADAHRLAKALKACRKHFRQNTHRRQACTTKAHRKHTPNAHNSARENHHRRAQARGNHVHHGGRFGR